MKCCLVPTFRCHGFHPSSERWVEEMKNCGIRNDTLLWSYSGSGTLMKKAGNEVCDPWMFIRHHLHSLITDTHTYIPQSHTHSDIPFFWSSVSCRRCLCIQNDPPDSSPDNSLRYFLKVHHFNPAKAVNPDATWNCKYEKKSMILEVNGTYFLRFNQKKNLTHYKTHFLLPQTKG